MHQHAVPFPKLLVKTAHFKTFIENCWFAGLGTLSAGRVRFHLRCRFSAIAATVLLHDPS
jgi:hypothetical protein